MSLKFYFGPSGAGKSRQLYEEILRRAAEEEKRNFFVIVPDQFTMQTQKELAALSPTGGIMNIDVLSFGRLGHRILEEVGNTHTPVLDDTGKSLVLQKVAGGCKDRLPALGSLLHRQGYIHEVKSAISEFMQYGVSPDGVHDLVEFAQSRGALVQKLTDLETLYRGFLEYIRDRFITTEETLDVLRKSLCKSKLLPDSVVVFDGFTGFTPIQNRVIQELMRLTSETIVVLAMGENEDPYLQDGEQKLFYLSKKTAADLEKLAVEAGVSRGQDVILREQAYRFREAPALRHLERNLFRYTSKPYLCKQEEIRIFCADTPADEVAQAGIMIHRLVREQGLAYRDIAVISGDLEGYAPYVERTFSQLSIPCYIDRTRGILLNPMIEYIKSALQMYIYDFSYETVFHYLRSGLSDLAREDIDLLENYVLKTGMRGYRRWSRLFTHKTREMGEGEETLNKLNELRRQLLEQTEMLYLPERGPAREYVSALYDFLVQNRVQEKLVCLKRQFEESGQAVRAKEYDQIYRLVLELLEQIHSLLGDEEISMGEFLELLEAGFGEIEVGTIPQNVDRVLVGDMERTRLKQVKVLFFLGINDGNIPKRTAKGGIISDIDREYLRGSDHELAPSPRQQMYIQRLYLYLNMTKPSRQLILSYAHVGSDGKSIRPAYLIDMVRKMYPGLETEYPQGESVEKQMVNIAQGKRYLAEEAREYAAGRLAPEEEKGFFTLYEAFSERGKERRMLTDAAFAHYHESGLSQAVARALYGMTLENSVSRLETYAACAYRHFLQYGLSLKEREEFGFEDVDMGNVFHAVLEIFSNRLREKRLTWFDFSPEFAQEEVTRALEECAATYGDTVLYSSARSTYAITRMKRILLRTVKTLQSQLKQGVFVPSEYELSFHSVDDLDSVHVKLSEQEKMHLRGRIDRVDVAEDDTKVYVKVIDYKSGEHRFDLAALYYGLQLQLVVYMNAAMEREQKLHPDKEVVPAALLYYRVEDPTVEMDHEPTEEELDQEIRGKLRMSGVVNSDSAIYAKLDSHFTTKSDVIPVELKKDGDFSSRADVLSGEQLSLLSDFVNRKLQKVGRQILDGTIALNPYERGGKEACTYCPYSRVCGFDPNLPGCAKRKLEELSKEEVLTRIQQEKEQ